MKKRPLCKNIEKNQGLKTEIFVDTGNVAPLMKFLSEFQKIFYYFMIDTVSKIWWK